MSRAVARRYAKALFEVASEQKYVDAIEKDLEQVVHIFQSTPDLMEWLGHPSIGIEPKKELLVKIFDELNQYTKNLLFLLVDRRREAVVPDIYEEYRKLANESKGIIEAVVTTAFKLTADDKKQVKATFEPMVGKKLELVEKVDSEILGGMIVQIGDRLYDGSLRTKLNRFQERLKRKQVG